MLPAREVRAKRRDGLGAEKSAWIASKPRRAVVTSFSTALPDSSGEALTAMTSAQVTPITA
ncbi:hypothetical protein ACWEOP_37630 [Streptomyces chartreusis]